MALLSFIAFFTAFFLTLFFNDFSPAQRGLPMSAPSSIMHNAMLAMAPIKKSLLLALIAACLWSGHAQANTNCLSCGASNASLAIPAASGFVVLGSLSLVVASGAVVVKGVEAVGDGVVIVLNGAKESLGKTEPAPPQPDAAVRQSQGQDPTQRDYPLEK
jgi:hypothetical protein